MAYLKFIKSVYQKESIKKQISYDLVESTCFNWLINTFKNEEKKEFVDYFLNVLNENCRTYWFFFPILFLEIEKGFLSGKVKVDFLTDKDFDSFKSKLNLPNETIENYKKQYSGQVMASVALGKYDRTKAELRALEICGLAIDVVKMYCRTVDDLTFMTDFDIEYRVKLNPSMNFLSMEIEMDGEAINPKDLLSHIHRNANHFILSKIYLQMMLTNGFGLVSNFIAKPTDNEVGRLIRQSIQLYAFAMSTSDMHRRVVDLFTIIESFLIKDENEPIQSSIIKYFPKIVTGKLEDRTLIKKILPEMYAVRSAMVHHGKRKEIDINNLRILQRAIRIMIINYVNLAKKHGTKFSILKEIDEAMDQAFKM